MRIYLDVSCLNRPFDDQTQPRIRLESEAVTIILGRCEGGDWEHVCSQMSVIELSAIADPVRRQRVFQLLPNTVSDLAEAIIERAALLTSDGLHAADAVHVAAAEASQAAVFLTCDDQLLRRCRQMRRRIRVRAENPKVWLEEQSDAADT